MANESITTTLPFESTGGNRVYGVSGQTSITPNFTGAGEEYSHTTVSVTLPALTTDSYVYVNPTAEASFNLPPLTVAGHTGARADVTLPLPTCTSAVTVVEVATASFDLPALTVESGASVGSVISASFSLPGRWTGTFTWGSHVSITLPAIRGEGSWVDSLNLNANFTLPALTASSYVSLTYEAASANITLPMLFMGSSVRSAITLPALTAYSEVSVDAPTYQAWAMNVQHSALTKFTGYPFKHMVRFKNVYYGVGFGGGLYKLENGDLDGAAPITWEVQTGLSDLNSPAQKGILDIYIDGLIESDINVGVTTDRSQEYVYKYRPKGAMDHRPHRLGIGKGLRSRNLKFRLSSTDGKYVEIDAIQPEYVISKRNI